MQQPPPNKLAQLRLKYREKYDAVTLVLYLLLCHGWALTVYPNGRDYALMAEEGASLTPLARWVFAQQLTWFDDWVLGYRLVNLVLLYFCMLFLHYLVGAAVRGPFWIATLAAVLFMANPATADAVLSLGGVGDLLPCLLALAALASYAYHATWPNYVRYAAALGIFFVASLVAPQNGLLFLIIGLYEWLVVPPTARYPRRVIPFVAVGLGLLGLHLPDILARGFDPVQQFVPLYFLFYPLGFLPETLQGFQQAPWTGWAAAAVAIALLVLLARKVRRPAMVFGLLAAFLFRFAGGDRAVDFVHLEGGGQLLTAGGLYALALVALFYRMMEHPKWRVGLVSATTLLCVVFFFMQFYQAYGWRQAGNLVRDFQNDAQAVSESQNGTPFAVLPDYQTFRSAPARLSESIAHNTPFSMALPHVALVPLHHPGTGAIEVFLESWTAQGGRLRISGAPARQVIAWPGGIVNPEAAYTSYMASWRVVNDSPDGFVIDIEALEPLPSTTLPGRTFRGD